MPFGPQNERLILSIDCLPWKTFKPPLNKIVLKYNFLKKKKIVYHN